MSQNADTLPDDGLDRRRRHPDNAKRCETERDAVRDGEGGHRLDQPPRAPRDDQQREHEQQMVHAAEDVLDAQRQVGTDHLCLASCGFDHERRH
jgi:hypothetical protein